MRKTVMAVVLLLMMATALPAAFLMPDEAFKPQAHLLDNQHVEVTIGLGEGIYVYEDKVDVRVLTPASITLAAMVVDLQPESHDGDMVYMKDIPIDLTFASLGADVEEVTFELAFQGCSEMGLCYEPQQINYTFAIDFGKAAAPEVAPLTSLASLAAEPAPVSAGSNNVTAGQTDLIVTTLKEEGLWTILALFFGFGFALSLTPCIFPMIPILSSIIVSQGKDLNARRGFLLSLVYVLAMSVAYAIAGVLAGLFGENLQVMLQNPVAIGGFALIFVALAFSMFGFFEIGLPASWQTRLNRASDEAGEKGGLIGVAVMGFLSALIVGPCVAPGLAAALIYIGQTGNAALGASALFVMSLGMGIPLLLIGLGAGRFMPRPGGWMETMTRFFGAVMIGIAIWMISRVVPESIGVTLWALFFIISAVYLGALEPLEGGRRSWNALFKGVGIIALIYGTLLLLGVLSGTPSLTRPLHRVASAGVAEVAASTFRVIRSEAELDAALEAARGKPVMLDFSATWCAACEEYETITFADAGVRDALKSYVLVQADVTENTPESKALMRRFNLFGPPAILFFDPQGELMPSKTLIGFMPPETFLTHLKEM